MKSTAWFLWALSIIAGIASLLYPSMLLTLLFVALNGASMLLLNWRDSLE